MALEINPTNITGVLLADGGWMAVRHPQLLSVASPSKWPATLAFQADDESWVYAPLASVLGLKTRVRQLSDADIAAESETRLASEARLFEWQHFVSKPVYDEAFERQGGLCPGPKCQGARLTDYAITHFHDGKIYCQLDTPLRHRYGTPS